MKSYIIISIYAVCLATFGNFECSKSESLSGILLEFQLSFAPRIIRLFNIFTDVINSLTSLLCQLKVSELKSC